MEYSQAVAYLEELKAHGWRLGLDRMDALMARLGNPQWAYQTVHVAGTNGKGSTVATLAALLEARGLKVGMMTSPHLLSYTERFQVNGLPVSEDFFAQGVAEIREAIEQVSQEDWGPVTEFEALTALGFYLFYKAGVQWGVIEVGMGGRLDATNCLKPELTIITPIGLDHQERLGPTLGHIAREKAGIMKSGVRALLGPQHPEAMEALLSTARGLDLPVTTLDWSPKGEWQVSEVTSGLSGTEFTLTGPMGESCYTTPLLGRYQAVNAGLALAALSLLDLGGESLSHGLARVRWPGRLEVIAQDPLVILDGAHNLEGVCELANALNELTSGMERILIFGALEDKPLEAMAQVLSPLFREIIVLGSTLERWASDQRLQEAFREATLVCDIKEAVRLAEERAGRDGLVVVAGSLYLVGMAQALWRESIVSPPHVRAGRSGTDGNKEKA